ncbi:MAG: twin transmembrane helix small protein [Proteobacteria bacterium]|nr:twin transmembrane helix small protein [Pseudomonadota bacterium]
MKFIVLILLLAIVVSLGYGLFFLSKDDQSSTRLLKSLKVRVALSAMLIAFLVLAYFMGWMPTGTTGQDSSTSSTRTHTEPATPHRQNASTTQQPRRRSDAVA